LLLFANQATDPARLVVRPAAALVNELRFTNVLIMVGMVAKEWVSVNRQVHGGWPSNSFVVDWNSGTTTYEYDPTGRLVTTPCPTVCNQSAATTTPTGWWN
jgi:hypothetical protein